MFTCEMCDGVAYAADDDEMFGLTSAWKLSG